ncbi:unnamed protein product [Gongylonema pulchrum]|uniref:Transposase n=1 Tax=Gongylonema pulchrum TaxID=637853 RepID=A0A183DFH7_9BILA|nr:unnamed protein product [Gongylonema pulchrum]
MHLTEVEEKIWELKREDEQQRAAFALSNGLESDD